MAGGPLNWLIDGLGSVDPKLRRIAELNELLAYKPWSIHSSHVKNLVT